MPHPSLRPRAVSCSLPSRTLARAVSRRPSALPLADVALTKPLWPAPTGSQGPPPTCATSNTGLAQTTGMSIVLKAPSPRLHLFRHPVISVNPITRAPCCTTLYAGYNLTSSRTTITVNPYYSGNATYTFFGYHSLMPDIGLATKFPLIKEGPAIWLGNSAFAIAACGERARRGDLQTARRRSVLCRSRARSLAQGTLPHSMRFLPSSAMALFTLHCLPPLLPPQSPPPCKSIRA